MPRGQQNAARRSLLADYSANCGQLISRRRSESALRAANIESALANKSKSEFLANMSHELRTPLNAIIGFSSIIKDSGTEGIKQGMLPPETISEYAEHISGAGTHLLRIITDILDILKIESGKMDLDIQEDYVANVIEHAVALLRLRIDQKKQTLDIHMPPDMPAIPFDTVRIRQVLLNLLSNAHKFTPEGGKLFIVVSEDTKGFVTFAVGDNGRGMTQEEIAHVVKPFTQAQSAYSRDHEGTGLGLPIAKALVLKHEGKFMIESLPGKGTTVVFALPLKGPGELSGKG